MRERLTGGHRTRESLSIQQQQQREALNPFKHGCSIYRTSTEKSDVIVSIRPAGHYWFDLGAYLEDEASSWLCNPYAVKQTKELDDNSQTRMTGRIEGDRKAGYR